jgi:hypothetical protein
MSKVKKVLRRFHKAGLKLNIEKSEFAFSEIKYLRFIISAGEGIKVDPGKVEAIKKWKAPTIVKGVRSFIGFSNFYRGFIENFSEIAASLMLIRKNQAWQWKKKQQKLFNRLKFFFISAPILAYWNSDKPTILKADCSGYSMGACFSQIDKSGKLKPVAYFSKKLSPAESNYEIHDKKLLAIVRAMEEWKGKLIRVKDPFVVFSDHKNLQYFMTIRKLSEKQVR